MIGLWRLHRRLLSPWFRTVNFDDYVDSFAKNCYFFLFLCHLEDSQDFDCFDSLQKFLHFLSDSKYVVPSSSYSQTVVTISCEIIGLCNPLKKKLDHHMSFLYLNFLCSLSWANNLTNILWIFRCFGKRLYFECDGYIYGGNLHLVWTSNWKCCSVHAVRVRCWDYFYAFWLWRNQL